MRFITALFPIFLTLAAARDHKSCYCLSHSKGDNGYHYNRDLTKWTCLNDFGGKANFDSGTGQCITHSHQRFDGDRFERDCIQRGVVEGYYLYKPNGSVDKKRGPIRVGGAYSKC
ncbi:hypothetical protein E4U19_000495 [Claviceps sp. Clav32 group G5]|nr:hypothetical protein E4U40_001791 [Claviceps sp. LM458 group G5]KAG6030383.1 hypothetical protein E4U19_000495 [Claviceps sp. Clav32 group G5]KAG6048197.1 hypothetical protein E4U39_007629 [Claviceps sp. Clav50 group G5]